MAKKKNNDVVTDKTNTLKRAMIVALEFSLGIVSNACKEVGINRSTHYDWMKSDEEYKKEVDSIQDIALDFAESKLFRQIDAENMTATIFYLKTKGKARGYVEKQEVSFVENDIDFSNISDEDLRKFINGENEQN